MQDVEGRQTQRGTDRHLLSALAEGLLHQLRDRLRLWTGRRGGHRLATENCQDEEKPEERRHPASVPGRRNRGRELSGMRLRQETYRGDMTECPEGNERFRTHVATICCIEVLRLADGRHPVGVLSQEGWVATTAESGRYVDLATSPSLVTVLETVPRVFFASPRDQLEESALEAGLIDTFPAEAAVQMGLMWPSAYWQEKALQWVQELEWAAKVQTELLAVQEDGRSHCLRHWERRLLKTTPRPSLMDRP